jgi:hypothetical protein
MTPPVKSRRDFFYAPERPGAIPKSLFVRRSLLFVKIAAISVQQLWK